MKGDSVTITTDTHDIPVIEQLDLGTRASASHQLRYFTNSTFENNNNESLRNTENLIPQKLLGSTP